MAAPGPGAPAPRGPSSGVPRGLRGPEMYRVAYEEGQRTLDDQVDELNGIRTRAVAYLAFVGTATAFLVGTNLKAVDPNLDFFISRNLLFFLMAGIATALLTLTLLAVIRVLVPKDGWEIRVSGEDLINDWIESDVPPPNEAHLLRALTLLYD